MRFITFLALCGILASAKATHAQPVTTSGPTSRTTFTTSFIHSTPTPADIRIEDPNIQERDHQHDDPDGSFFPETKNICLSRKGTRYKAQSFCHQHFTSFWQTGAYFAYKAEFDDYRAANKDRSHDGKFIEKKICDTFAEKWVVEGCEYGNSEGRYYCCDVRRVRGRDGEMNEAGDGEE